MARIIRVLGLGVNPVLRKFLRAINRLHVSREVWGGWPDLAASRRIAQLFVPGFLPGLVAVLIACPLWVVPRFEVYGHLPSGVVGR